MSTIKSKYRNGQLNMPTPSGPEVVSVYTEVELAAGELVADNVVQMFTLPANCVPVGYSINNDDLDSNGTPTLVADLGILDSTNLLISTGAADGGDEWIDGSTALQAAALTLHTASRAAFNVLKQVQKADHDRIVAVVLKASSATAAAGTLGMEFSYRAA